MNVIDNMGWVKGLEPVDEVTLEARAEGTIKYFRKLLLEDFEDKVTSDLGEYIISDTAQQVLVKVYDHAKWPLAELIKEKITGNPGFDFHSESPNLLIVFGEAKYGAKSNPHGRAFKQINKFIHKKKDIQEFSLLKPFASQGAMNNAMEGNKSYAAAFSVNSSNPEKILHNALCSQSLEKLLEHPEVYLIGVILDD